MDPVQFVGDPWKVFPTWSRSATICSACAERFKWRFGPYDHEGIQQGGQPSQLAFTLTREALELSVASGCPLCTIVMQTLRLNQEVDKLDMMYQLLNTNPQRDPTNLDLLRVTENWLDTEGKQHQTGYDFWIHAYHDNSAGKFFRTRDINPVVGSQSAFDQARRWIAECTETHRDCKKPEVVPLPSRVIDTHPCSLNNDPTLFISNGQEAPYAALSYCWGDKQPNALLQENLSEYVDGISMANLPQTIRDAITVTMKLGLRYLWVDSLCIIQDSVTDKRREISKMRQIFRHALVTISAATAKSVFEGFLQIRPHPVPSLRIPLQLPDGNQGTVSLYSDGDEPHLTYTESDHPVENRAWTLEEKVLSPRVLVYSATHLRWLCDSGQYSDGGAQENFMDYKAARYRLPLKEREIVSHPSENNVPTTSMHESWRILVAEFTRRSLTAPEDKLRAIAGLAEEYAYLMNDIYKAGLWMSEIITELLWRRNSFTNAGKLRPRPRNYRAPSWSWASMDGEVHIRKQNVEAVEFEVAECTTTLLSEIVPFGEVSSAILKVHARTRVVWWNRTTENIFDREGGIQCGKGVPDALEDKIPITLTVTALRVSANNGMLITPEKEEGGLYQRVGWLYFDNDDMFDRCERSIVSIV